MPFFAGKTFVNAASQVIRRKRFDFDHVTFTSHVCTLSKVNMVDNTSSESSSISGSDYSDFEASMEGEHNKRVYESVCGIRPWIFEPPGRT